jgi:hypothetical protein
MRRLHSELRTHCPWKDRAPSTGNGSASSSAHPGRFTINTLDQFSRVSQGDFARLKVKHARRDDEAPGRSTPAIGRVDLARCARHPSADPNPAKEGTTMNEDLLNMEIRKFLKHVGVTAQREIETAVREALKSGKLKGKKSVSGRMTLTIDGLSLKHEIADDIAFE